MSTNYDFEVKRAITQEINGAKYVRVLETSNIVEAETLFNDLQNGNHLTEIIKESNQYLVFFRSKNWN